MSTTAIDEAVAAVLDVMEERPEKNWLNLYEDLAAGRRPRGCPLSLGRCTHWSEIPVLDDTQLATEDPLEQNLLNSLRGMAGPLASNNCYTPVLGCGVGVPSVASAFGVVPDTRPRNQGGVVAHLPLEAFDDCEPPDVNTAGCWPQVREAIEFYKAHTPPEIKIVYPDMQGPINTSHSILGTEVFVYMRTEPERLHHLLQMITDFNIQARRAMAEWIGADRMVDAVGYTSRIAECSVDLISRADYREFGLPCDTQIAAALGPIAIHMDGGRHVFEETLRGLPQIRLTEWCETVAGFAPQISQDEALAEIGDRPIALGGGVELWEGDFEAMIREKLDRLEDHPLQTFGFSIMTWRESRQPEVVALRGRLDDYYAQRWG
ncbi:MAG TPA: uroporphyrinogen decarboxylase family protein [Armatimonadota bacterium]|jgi:hypothetical protein